MEDAKYFNMKAQGDHALVDQALIIASLYKGHPVNTENFRKADDAFAEFSILNRCDFKHDPENFTTGVGSEQEKWSVSIEPDSFSATAKLPEPQAKTNPLDAIQSVGRKPRKTKQKVFTVAEVPGSSRTSDRDYTHAVIGQYDYDAAIVRAAVVSKTDVSNAQYHLRVAGAKAGDQYSHDRSNFPIDQKMIDYAKERVGNNTDPQVIAQAEADARVAKVKQQQAEHDGKLVVLRWSQRLDSAHKGHSEFSSYKNLRVVETVRVN